MCRLVFLAPLRCGGSVLCNQPKTFGPPYLRVFLAVALLHQCFQTCVRAHFRWRPSGSLEPVGAAPSTSHGLEICHGLSEWRCCGRKCVLRSLQCCDSRSDILTKVTRSFAQPASFLRQATHLNRRCTTQEHEVSVTGQHDVLHIACCRAFTAFPESLTSSTSWGSSLVITNPFYTSILIQLIYS